MLQLMMGGRFALQDRPPQAYNEEAFRYFLEIERKRSTLSNRPVLLMLIEITRDPGTASRIAGVTARKLFTVLSRCLRETDFTGWYREGHTLGAVLTQHGEIPRDDLPDVVRQRIEEALRQCLSPDLARRLHVRVTHLSPEVPSW